MIKLLSSGGIQVLLAIAFGAFGLWNWAALNIGIAIWAVIRGTYYE